MKKRLLYFSNTHFLSVLMMIVSFSFTPAFAQVTTNSGSGLAATYPSLAAAITALNSATITSPVIITLTGNETAPAGGYSITQLGGTATNTITIQGSSSTLTAYTPQTAGQQYDAIIKIVGGDYITIQNFSIVENSGNTVATVGTNTMTEFGVALFAASTSNGAQNNTIQNNTITLSSATAYQNSIGIMSSCSFSASGSAQDATSSAGTNSNNKYYSNIISGVAYGLYFVAPVQTASIFESGNDIGGSSASTGNTITYGISNTAANISLNRFSGGTPAGVYLRNVVGNSVRYNTISSVSTLTLVSGGIFSANATNPSGVTYTSTFSNNTITITNAGTTAVTGIDFGSGLSTGTLIASSNNITINQNASAAVSAAIIGIRANYASATNTLNLNTININQNPTVAGSVTSPVTGINAAGAGTTVNVNNNVITVKQALPGGTASFGSGAITYIDVSAGSGTVNVNLNQLLTTGSTIRSSGTCIGVNHTTGTISVRLTIDQNTINIDRIASAGTLNGTNESTSPSTVAHTITNNNITFTNLAGTSTANGIMTLGGVSATGTSKSINSNTVNISGSNSGTSIGIQTGYSTGTMNNNTVTISTASNTLTGLQATSTSAGSYTITGNGISLTSSSTSPTAMTAIDVGATGPYQIYSNTFSALNFTGIISASPTVTGVAVAAGVGNNIYNNTITNMTVGAATSSGSPLLRGIAVTGGTTTNVYKNKIYGLTTPATGTSTLVSGITLSGGATNTVYNNLIGDLNTTAAASTDAVRGINITSTTTNSTQKIYYNSVYLSASSTGANFGTSGIYHITSTVSTTSALDMRNNVIVNKSTPAGTGLTVAFRRSAGTASALANYASTSNNNLLYAGTPGAANLIYSDGTSTAQTMTAYKSGAFTAGTIAPRDAASFAENAPFLSTSGGSSNFLHINPLVGTQIEGGAQTISGITDDYDGNTRNATTPDVGADEGNFTLVDLTGPTITYTNFLNTSSTTTYTVSVTSISDVSGVDVNPGTAPRLYYKRSGDANTYNSNDNSTDGWKWVETSSSSSPYAFDIDFALIFGGSVTSGNTIQYFVVAQDLALTPNVGINSGTLAKTASSVDLTASEFPVTGTINNFNIVPSISGVKTVGLTGADYNSITAAITALSGAEITGPVVLSLIDATYAESVTIPVLAGASATNTVTIKPAAGNTVVWSSSSTTSGTVRLNGADYIIIDGSNNGTTSRNMTISNTASATFSVPVWISSLGTGAGATFVTVKNCNLAGGSTSLTTSYGVFIAGQTLSATGTGDDNDNVTIQNNVITKAYTGVYARASATGPNNTLVISGNTIGSSTATDYIGKYGLDLTYTTGSTFSGNTIFSMVGTISNPTGMLLGTSILSSSVNANKIYQLNYTGTTGYGGKGIDVSTSSATSALTISNNLIFNLLGDGWSDLAGDATVGIRILGTSGGINIWYNSVNLYGNTSRSGTATLSAAIYVSSSSTNLDIRNNILSNSIVNTTNSGSKSYAIYSAAANTAFTQLNRNVYYASGTQAVLGYLGADKTTLTDWQAATGKDANSLASDPTFKANDDLQPYNGSPALAAGTPVSVTTDYTGATRSGSTPSIGAYESGAVYVDIVAPVISYTNLVNTTKTTSYTLSNVTITDPGSGVNVTGGTAPRVYYKKSTNDNAFVGNTSGDNGWKYVESTTGSSPFSFTLDLTKIFGGLVATDVVQYFVVAQDLAPTPNVGINSGTFAATPATVNLLPAQAPIGGTIKTFTIVSAITGEILVGTGQAYTSLTKSDGLFNAINTRVVTGNMTVKITSDLAEDGAVALNQSVEEAIYTIKIVPNDAAVKTISGSNATGLIKLNGADGVVFDGRFNETGTANYLTFSNTNAAGAVFQLISLGTNAGASNNTIRNCNIIGGSITATSTYGIHIGSATLGTAAADNDNNSILNNVIKKVYTGIFAKATSAGTNNSLNISGNTIGSTTATEYIGKNGLDLTYTTGSTFSGNTIFSMEGTINNPTGIMVGTSVLSSTFDGNKIYQIKYTGTGGYGGKGIDINTGSGTSALTISNNLIYNISGDGYSTLEGDAIVGIRILGTTGGLNIWYNSINLYGNISRSGATADISTAIYIASTVTNLDIRNNIFANSIDNITGVASAYAIYSAAANTAFTQINNNVYYATGAEGKLGYLGAAKTTLADWQAATGKDANSLASNPTFRANDNLQPVVGSPALTAGSPVTVTTDYTGATRNATNPSIGAYETGYTPPGVDWANLQWPATMSLKEGVKGDVYAQVYKAGVTEPAGQGAGISVWIGVSATNTNPNTWTSWTAATFNTQSGNNDEYTAQIGGTLAEGTYYYASRILLEGGIYQYGGYNGGFWDGTTNVSGVLTVTNGEITYANLQFPSTASINEGGSATVYGRVYADGVTNVAGASGIVAELGWSATNNNPNLWTNWTTASFNVQVGNNDEYQAAFGSSLTTGTYYYAYRFKLANDAYYYGGYSGTGGGAWDGTTNISGVLTVNPFIANVPYLQNFDGVTAPALPAGWTVLDANSDTYKWSNAASNPRTSPNAMKAVYNSAVNTVAMDDWFFSPGVNLTAGVEYEVVFYYRAESATYPEKLEVKWGNAANVAGMTGGTLFTNSSITNITYSKGSGSFTPSSSGVYYIGFHGFSLADMFNLYVDDVLIRVKPVATNSQTIAANNTTLFTFTGTGAQVQFTTGNTGSVTLQFEKIPGNPRGTLPSPVLNVANTYWTGTITSGTVTGTYTLTLDLTGVPGIGNPATIHLLKRSDINGSWVDIGYPTDVSAFPLVSWANITSGFSDFGLGGENDNPLPVELVNFSAKAKSRNVNLTWETKTETDNSGFEVERKDKNGDWKKIGFVEGFGSSNSPKYYAFEDKKLSSGKHNYRLKQIDNDGTTSYSDEVEVTIDLPTEFALSQNYPNPFNPSTKVDYQLAMDAKVTIELYSITGEKVATLLSQELEAGYYSMMIDSYTHGMASGIYIYRMIATDALGKSFVSTKKLSLIK